MLHQIIEKILNKFDSEQTHNQIKTGFKFLNNKKRILNILKNCFQHNLLPNIPINIYGMELQNPVILGAGWDKNGECTNTLHKLFNFGAIEIGSVLFYPNSGNSLPRQWVIKNKIVNNLGLPSEGFPSIYYNIENYNFSPIGVNLYTEEMVEFFHMVSYLELLKHIKYYTLNISCPNINSKNIIDLPELLKHYSCNSKKPLFIKISPDIPNKFLFKILELISMYNNVGLIVGNTTKNNYIKNKYNLSNLPGGVSGDCAELRKRNFKKIEKIKNFNSKIEIIGCGGIINKSTAQQYIDSGSSAIQVVSWMRLSSLGRSN